MRPGLRLPFLSEADPEFGTEGGIDPLGLSSIADRLADSIAPGLTARMSRVRYLTTICVATAVLERLNGRTTRDDSPPFLAFEWLLVEAFARKGKELPVDARQIPGIEKARIALARGERMGARNYLKSPKVFGFHGVYRTLAEATGLVDRDGVLRESGERLVRAWERDLKLSGFVDRDASTEGGRHRRRLESALDDAVQKGRVDLATNSGLHENLFVWFRPDSVGRTERALLRQLLLDPGEPIRRELFLALAKLEPTESESDLAARVLRSASSGLATRLRAIQRFETFAGALTHAFDLIRFRSSLAGTSAVLVDTLSQDKAFVRLARQIPLDLAKATQALGSMEDPRVPVEFETRFARFAGSGTTGTLFELLAQHHEEIQRQKFPKGRRSWFDRVGAGLCVRSPYRIWSLRDPGRNWIHPFRLLAMRRFLGDLGT